MASTNFVDFSTPIVASWLNDINGFFYSLFAGATTPAQALAAIGGIGSNNPTFTGNVTMSSIGSRFFIQSAQPLQSNCFAFQDIAPNVNTSVISIPSGTGITGQFLSYANSDPDNSSRMVIASVKGVDARIAVDATGSGALLPLNVYVGGAVRLTIDTIGRVGVGVVAPVWATDNYVLGVGPIASLVSNGAATRLSNNIYFSNVTGNWSTQVVGFSHMLTMNATNGVINLDVGSNVAAGAVPTFRNLMTILPGGQIGMGGNTNPTYMLDLNTPSSIGIRVFDGTVTLLMTPVSSNAGYIGTASAHPLGLYTANVRQATIATNGDFSLRGTLIVGATGSAAAEGGEIDIISRDGVTTGALIDIDGGNNFRFLNAQVTQIAFHNNGSQRLTIQPSGTVVVAIPTVNTNGISARLAVAGIISGASVDYTAQPLYLEGAPGSPQVGIGFHAPGVAAAGVFRFVNTQFEARSATDAGFIPMAAFSFPTPSDYRLKDVVGEFTDSGAVLDALNPVYGTWKEDGRLFRGFLAHEFQEVFPDSVIGEKDAVEEDGTPKSQLMDAATPEVIAIMVAELKSLRQRVAALEI